jgi:pantetheine-phosphate adenylyltransferase/dephospho-CoA kinase
MIIGVTGNSGSGKTTFAQMFGYKVLNADDIYHRLLAENDEMKRELDAEFGTHKRPEMAKVVFADTAKLQRLNEITHKYVLAAIEDEIRGDVVIDAPLLFESGLDKQCEKTIAVVANRSLRVERIMSRDGVSEVAALERVRAQQPDEYYIKHADYVVNSDEGEVSLRAQAEKLKKQFFSRVAIYGGTFDPPTIGHLDVIRRAARLFDKVYVVTLIHEHKMPVFTVEERVDLLEQITTDLPNVKVEQWTGLLADYANKVGAHYSVRGVRSGFDTEYERPLYEFNAQIAADNYNGYELDTIFVPTSLAKFDCSSSNVKTLLSNGAYKTAEKYLDPRIADQVIAKFQ